MCISAINFLQQNGAWISGLGMAFFSGVQVWVMFLQNRQQLRLKRLELIQELDEVAFDFDGTREAAIKVQIWFVKHQSICALLLNKKDAEKILALFKYLMKIRKDQKPVTIQDAIERTHQFNSLMNEVTKCLGIARYGFTRENMFDNKRKA